MATELDVDLAEMARRVKEVGDNFNFAAKIVRDFGAAPTLRPMIVNLTQARQLLKDSGNNLKAVQVALKAMNVPAKDMALLMGKLGSELGKARKEALGFGAAIGSWSSRQLEAAVRSARALTTEMGKRAGGAAGSALKYGAYGAVGAVAAGTAGGMHLLEKVIETAGFREASIKGLEYNLGRREISAHASAEEAMKQRAINAKAEADAADLFAEGLKLAQKTPIADREIMQAIKDFVAQGYKPREAKFLVKVMADQQSKFLEDPRVKENFVTAFSRGQGRGVATNRDLESLRIAKFKTSDVLANLVNQPGVAEVMQGYKSGKYKVSEAEIQQVFDEEIGRDVTRIEAEAIIKLKKILSTGLIQTSTLQNAAIAANYAGENLEEAAGALAKLKAESTLPGAINNAANAFENLLLSMDAANSKGMVSLRNFLNQYTEILGHSKILRSTIDGLVNALLGPLEKITPEKMEAVIKTIGKLGEQLMHFFEKAWKWLEQIIEAKPGALTDAMKDVLVDIGKYLGAGIKTGMWEGIKAVATEPVLSQNAIEQTAAGGIPWRKKAVFPWQREFWGGGSTEETPAPVTAAPGKSFADGGVVPGPMGTPQLIVAHGGERFQGVNNRNPSGGGASLVIQGPLFVVNGDVKDPDALGAAIKPLVQEEFANVWHRLAMEQG
jgi:hypothetical protein